MLTTSLAVLVAEIVAHFFPRMIELHNYRLGAQPLATVALTQVKRALKRATPFGERSSAHGRAQKMYNWTTLNQKVFKRLGFAVSKLDCERVINAEPGACALWHVRASKVDGKTQAPSSKC